MLKEIPETLMLCAYDLIQYDFRTDAEQMFLIYL
nr:MAG: hypothetical protein [Bacteriophage sp.]DAL85572.1 MAG TPA: hypothetical protein [Caudoviricetes sp.]